MVANATYVVSGVAAFEIPGGPLRVGFCRPRRTAVDHEASFTSGVGLTLGCRLRISNRPVTHRRCTSQPWPNRPLNLSQKFHASNVEMATTAHCPQKSRLAAGIERGIDAVIVNRSQPASARANRRTLSSYAQARQYPSKLRDIHHSGSDGCFAASGRGVLIGE
jgi:hypothetical protein